jgi:6-phosphogluconolactonase (cycloisomerase 2 family)
MHIKRHEGVLALLVLAIIATGTLTAAQSAAPSPSASRLVSVQHFPSPDGDMCAWQPADDVADVSDSLEQEDRVSALQKGRPGAFLMASLQPGNLLTTLQRGSLLTALQQGTSVPQASERVLRPLRTIRDTHPTYSAIAVDVTSDEVILQDNNLWSYRVFNRLDNTPPGVEMTPPKRIVSGSETALQFNNGLYVDPKNGDIYSVESDTGDKMVVFSRDANGNVKPKRILNTPHRVYNIAVDEVKQELFVTREFPAEVDVYRKEASGDEQPLRTIQGEETGLGAPHGVAVDSKNGLLYVNNWGHHSNFRVPGTGRYEDPSIRVYRLDAKGDAAPLREIRGDRTQMNWPAAMKLNPDNGDLYVANDIGQSILVFRNAATANGNVAPVRVIKGPKTKLRNPTGVFVDTKNQEVWVSNLGNASATAYPLMANGDVAPLRIIRSAPEGKKSLNFGRTAAVAYDSNREQLLVPN